MKFLGFKLGMLLGFNSILFVLMKLRYFFLVFLDFVKLKVVNLIFVLVLMVWCVIFV